MSALCTTCKLQSVALYGQASSLCCRRSHWLCSEPSCEGCFVAFESKQELQEHHRLVHAPLMPHLPRTQEQHLSVEEVLGIARCVSAGTSPLSPACLQCMCGQQCRHHAAFANDNTYRVQQNAGLLQWTASCTSMELVQMLVKYRGLGKATCTAGHFDLCTWPNCTACFPWSHAGGLRLRLVMCAGHKDGPGRPMATTMLVVPVLLLLLAHQLHLGKQPILLMMSWYTSSCCC